MPLTDGNDQRMLAWMNGLRQAKAAGAFGAPGYVGSSEELDLAYAKRAYMLDEIELDEFERQVEMILARG